MKTCKICGTELGDNGVKLKNVRKDLSEEFNYLKCKNCGCVQIQEIPDNLGDYYDNDEYYSFGRKDGTENGMKAFIKRTIKSHLFGKKIYINGKEEFIRETQNRIIAICGSQYDTSKKIVDVGCGGGIFLNQLRILGFKNLLGIDPYLEEDRETQMYVPLEKKSIAELRGEWDMIWMMHSLEHIPDPQKDLIYMSERLKETGIGVIVLPICDSYDYETYGNDWAGCDAPVHLFLHTRKSLNIMFEKAGLHVIRELHLENEWPLLLSEKVASGYAIDDHNKTLVEILGEEKMDYLKKKQLEINREKKSGMVTFVVGK